MEVDRAVADAAAAEVGDERLAQTVQQRAAEEDRDAARAGVCVDLGHVRRLDVRRVEAQVAGDLVAVDLHAVQREEPCDDADVGDVRHVAEDADFLAEERRDHGLRHEVLRATHLDATRERASAVEDDGVAGQTD